MPNCGIRLQNHSRPRHVVTISWVRSGSPVSIQRKGTQGSPCTWQAAPRPGTPDLLPHPTPLGMSNKHLPFEHRLDVVLHALAEHGVDLGKRGVDRFSLCTKFDERFAHIAAQRAAPPSHHKSHFGSNKGTTPSVRVFVVERYPSLADSWDVPGRFDNPPHLPRLFHVLLVGHRGLQERQPQAVYRPGHLMGLHHLVRVSGRRDAASYPDSWSVRRGRILRCGCTVAVGKHGPGRDGKSEK